MSHTHCARAICVFLCVQFGLTEDLGCFQPVSEHELLQLVTIFYFFPSSVDQIEDVLSSIEPAKGYLTQFIKMIHDHLLV